MLGLKSILYISLIIPLYVFQSFGYTPGSGVSYANQYCSSYNSKQDGTCSPYKVYSDNDCANFISQCLINGGMVLSGTDPCGCIIAALNLESFLLSASGWSATSNYTSTTPPSNLAAGDVIIWHGNTTHSTIVSQVSGSSAYLDYHTSNRCNASFSGMFSEFSYCTIFHYGG
jgi:hypothetical protein